LTDLGLETPGIDVPLHTIDNAHLKEMQKVPLYAQSGGAEPIRKIKDRVVFKYKSSNVRAAVTKLKESEVASCVREFPQLGRWWAIAAGYRQEDSVQYDFYATLPTSSDSLMPTTWDERRLEVELANEWVSHVRATVRRLIRRCLTTGEPTGATAANHYIRAHVTDGDLCYLTLGTGGIYDQKVIAVILDAVPGVHAGDWFIEPSVELAVEPNSGEVIWSTVLPEEAREQLLAEQDG
jgi:hypothetical protein